MTRRLALEALEVKAGFLAHVVEFFYLLGEGQCKLQVAMTDEADHGVCVAFHEFADKSFSGRQRFL